MMRRLCFTLAGLLVAAAASAQTGALVNLRVQFLQNGAVLPTQVMTIALSTATCGVTPKIVVPASVFINTSGRVVWDDPTTPALADCVALQTAGGTLTSLPLGANYTASATFIDDTGAVSPSPSAPSNSFTRGARPLPPVPTGVRVLP